VGRDTRGVRHDSYARGVGSDAQARQDALGDAALRVVVDDARTARETADVATGGRIDDQAYASHVFR
jgi:hypothetical protein